VIGCWKHGGGNPPGPGRNGERDFRGEQRKNDTHASTTDPDARLFRKAKGQASQLCYMSHTLMENRNALIVDHRTTPATGTAERETAVAMVGRLPGAHRVTVGADKNYDTRECVDNLRFATATPHVAQNDTNRRSAIDGRTTRHAGYTVSQRIRKRIEEGFGWGKAIGPLRKVKLRGIKKVEFLCTMTYAAYNLVRMRSLLPTPGIP